MYLIGHSSALPEDVPLLSVISQTRFNFFAGQSFISLPCLLRCHHCVNAAPSFRWMRGLRQPVSVSTRPSTNSCCIWFITADRPLWRRKLHLKFKVWGKSWCKIWHTVIQRKRERGHSQGEKVRASNTEKERPVVFFVFYVYRNNLLSMYFKLLPKIHDINFHNFFNHWSLSWADNIRLFN